MKICSDNIHLSLEAKHIDKKSNLKSNVKSSNNLLSINSKNNKNAGSAIAEIMKQKQQLEKDIIDLQKKQEKYELKVKTEIEEIQKQIAGLEDNKNQIIKENVDDIDTLNEVSHRLNEKDKKNETIEKLDKENKVQASNEDKEIESIQKEINNLNKKSKESSLSGNIVDEYR